MHTGQADGALRVTLSCPSGVPQVDFAAEELERALAEREGILQRTPLAQAQRSTGTLRVAISASAEEADRLAEQFSVRPPTGPKPEAYAIRLVPGNKPTVVVLATDPVGAMYGGMDTAEAIRLGTLDQLQDAGHAPHILRRGIKFNIPLDARTPSYSDASDSAQQNISEVWEMSFWTDYLDELARHRFNAMTLWNLHPFPSMVKVPEFPEVALDDVMRTRAKFDDTFSLCGHDMVRPETLADLECVKKISIDQKIEFWRQVMQYAHDRGIETYIFTWNIFTFGADGKYGITHEQDNERTIDYFRATVREMVRTYPLLAGLGITAGERLEKRDDEFDKESWLWKAYGEGVRDALGDSPQRDFRMIHRYHQSNLDSILNAWRDYPCTFDVSFKYAIAHMYSHPAPPFAREALQEMPGHLRMWMTVRNDDIYSFRWGDPDFARAFICALPDQDQIAGYYMGPDGYTWGREFISTEPDSPRQLIVQKQWYSFMMWGRLSYDPALPNALFEQTLAARFSTVNAAALYRALAQASRIIPLVNRCHWERLDFQWFPEACISRASYKGFHTIHHFVERPSMPESGVLSVADFVDAELRGATVDGQTPAQVASELRELADTARFLAASISPGEDRELRQTLGDIEAMAHLGEYYAAKFDAAVSLCRYDRGSDAIAQQAAIEQLESAADHWRRYAAAAQKQYTPQLLTRIGWVDLSALTRQVEADVQLARDWDPNHSR